MRNWDPCSHCLSSNCSRLCGAPPLAVLPPLNIELSDGGPCELGPCDPAFDNDDEDEAEPCLPGNNGPTRFKLFSLV